jgi:6-phosphofructokinase 1
MDRVLASRLGVAAVEALRDGRKGEMIGLVHGKIHYTPFKDAIKHISGLDPQLFKLVEILSL